MTIPWEARAAQGGQEVLHWDLLLGFSRCELAWKQPSLFRSQAFTTAPYVVISHSQYRLFTLVFSFKKLVLQYLLPVHESLQHVHVRGYYVISLFLLIDTCTFWEKVKSAESATTWVRTPGSKLQQEEALLLFRSSGTDILRSHWLQWQGHVWKGHDILFPRQSNLKLCSVVVRGQVRGQI